ncbi:hypothetical protein MTR80_05575 [Alcaligenes aquatilis]|uniref:Uncharacterized protein n=1 Tax=Alcaligenes aquatilis TaxID=323284 RepID=A0ABY4NLB9_9BURK|nr:hypothetical protein [Alcaligenes aquatilis]UQN37172.1 hypothetical protein MTR80_05575 [Alcaligenes aquatilis]
MWCVPRYLVQSTEDGSFLAADGEGGVINVMALTAADPFQEPESAVEAVQDYLDGRGVVILIYVPCIQA